MSETHKLTAEAAERLETEVTRLEGEGRREIAERIGIAREWGDLKENAEYHAAKEEAAMLEAKIARMRDQLRTSEIVEAAAAGDGAGMYSAVTYADAKAGKEMTFTLVPATEADPSAKKRSRSTRRSARPWPGPPRATSARSRPRGASGRSRSCRWSSRDRHRDLP